MPVIRDNEWYECKSRIDDYNLIKCFLFPLSPGTSLKRTVKNIQFSRSFRELVHLPCVSAVLPLLKKHK